MPAIPVIAPQADDPAAVGDHGDRLAAILEAARRQYGARLLRLGDRLSRHWAHRADIPYRHEIALVADRIGMPGAWLLNLSYEWGCTTAGVDPGTGAPMLIRTLDWSMPALGATVIAVRRDGPTGPWISLGWPGFVGVVQAMAPGRFAAAINQAPRPATGFGAVLDWLAARTAVWRSRRLPPVLLLRRVFESCRDFAEARARLAETPVSLPVIFTLVGCRPGEAAVIERLADRGVITDGPAAVTNHWLSCDLPGRSRSPLTVERLAALRGHIAAARHGAFAWLIPPILNGDTRLALEAEPANGSLKVQGFEHGQPATAPLALCEPLPAGVILPPPAPASS